MEVSRLKVEGEHPVGGVPGLYLRIDGGSRAWVLRYNVDGKRRRMGLGAFPGVPLAAARERARKERALLDLGHDPIAERLAGRERQIQKRAMTFKVAMEKCIDSKSAEWSNAKHAQQWTNTLTTYALPSIGEMSVADITTDDILKVLQPIWTTKTETATRVRQRIETILDWATVLKKRSGDNPARWGGHLEVLLARPSKVTNVVHHKAVPYAESPDAFRRISATHGNGGRALMFQILTAVRSGEARGALWSEIDDQSAMWILPADRMKGRREHRVPLSSQAIALLMAQPRIAGTDLIFPSLKKKPLSDMTLSAVMKRLSIEGVPHGFRSSFKDWATEVAHAPTELSEMALAHVIESKTEAAYRRGDLLARRAKLMQQWADYVAPVGK
ncbi:tyrosine-type recombinase/integrase [Ottowia sp. VDI28]|uniref:tyrosine-type recombinase/integrase n=1 Tax=Ottowia sp. VDI28 TaxID=3133968 RepID=UPI003C2C6A49